MTQRSSEVLQSVADDMAADAKAFDGQPFNGRTVAEYFGNQGAAIACIANIVKDLVNEESTGTLGKAEKEVLALRAEVNDLKVADFAVAGAIQEIRAKLGDLEKRLITTVENPGGTPGQGAPPEPLPDPNSDAAALRMLLADLVQFCQGEDRGVVDVPVSLLRNAEQWLRRLAKEVAQGPR